MKKLLLFTFAAFLFAGANAAVNQECFYGKDCLAGQAAAPKVNCKKCMRWHKAYMQKGRRQAHAAPAESCPAMRGQKCNCAKAKEGKKCNCKKCNCAKAVKKPKAAKGKIRRFGHNRYMMEKCRACMMKNMKDNHKKAGAGKAAQTHRYYVGGPKSGTAEVIHAK
ncbi:MAG: hypothetical protein LBR90_02490 [Elusimicrobiota bacterium]|jgi:hypothetical protein|nr:hypothetical protein [Elusimicrobiota bacterium]